MNKSLETVKVALACLSLPDCSSSTFEVIRYACDGFICMLYGYDARSKAHGNVCGKCMP